MNSKNLIPGGILVTLGLLFLADNFDIFEVSWHAIFRLWPLLLILMGINMLIGKRNPVSTGLTIVVLCIAIPIAVVSNWSERWSERHHDGKHWRWDWDDDSDNRRDRNNEEDYNEDDSNNDGGDVHQSFTEPMEGGIKTGSFYLGGGAAKFKIEGTSDQLAEVKSDLTFGKGYDLTKVINSGNADIKLKAKDGDNHVELNNNDSGNKVNIKLNTEVEWNLDLEIGVGATEIDLSKNNVRNLKLKTGVSDTEIRLGDKSAETTVKVEAGVAQVELQVPNSVGCRIKIDGALNGKDFDGFTKNGDSYESPDYAKATKKINIEFDGGLSNLKVKRY